MPQTKDKTIAIVGGGPGGLTLARLLQMNGGDVKVYERDVSRDARVQGATLDLHEDSGLRALREAGLMEAFRANYRPGADKVLIVDRNAKTFLDEFSSEDLGTERPEIDRGPLRDLLLDSLQADTVVWGRQLTSLARLEGTVRLEFADGASASADVVIGADGANSKVRPAVTPIKPVYSGVTVIEGSVHDTEIAAPRIHKLLGIGKICALGNEKSLFIGAKGDGSLSFYTGHKAAESWARTCGIDFSKKADVLNWFKDEFHGWDEIWDELFQNADLPFIPRPQYYMPPDQSWEALPNLTLLGDAAHVMPPYAGEGVNMAMLDALELAECLMSDAFPDTRAAIAAYETKMRGRASSVIQMTLEQTAVFHSPDALPQLVDMFMSHHTAKEAAAIIPNSPN